MLICRIERTPANDPLTPGSPMSIRRALLAWSAAAACVLAPAAAGASQILYSHTFTDSDPSGSLRLLRDAVPSVAGTQKAFPGTSANNPTYFDTLDLFVEVGSVITVTDTSRNGAFQFFSLYDTSFSIANLATNYLGDAGSTALISDVTFSVTAPLSGHVVLVANSIAGNSALGRLATATITYTPAAVPEPATLGSLALASVIGLGSMARRRMRPAQA